MVDNSMMKKVCGFTIAGTRSKAINFNAKRSWAELSPHTTWDSAGMSNRLIQDLPTAIVHRFICYNISRKKEANKASEVELFLLWAMRAGVRVCSMTFLQNPYKRLPSLGVEYRHLGILLPHSPATSKSLQKPTIYMERLGFKTGLRCDVSILMSSSRLTLLRTGQQLRSIRSVMLTTPILKISSRNSLTPTRQGRLGHRRRKTSMRR
ncbi:sarcosine dehydrogenase [Striga asiatica]|uniref:Sarcosine dehydrogenase n=1 Tax=Striga asiatica TaxID=4170 RepID=A0A5A7QUV7_STRAF|nr:sarcosine dehydrogenase [Striga asiatica]